MTRRLPQQAPHPLHLGTSPIALDSAGSSAIFLCAPAPGPVRAVGPPRRRHHPGRRSGRLQGSC